MIRDAAMSSIARVIFLVDSTDLIRARYSRSDVAIGGHLRPRLQGHRGHGSAPLLLDDLLLLELVVGERLVLLLAGPDALARRRLELVEELVVRRRELGLGGVLELLRLPDAG